MHNPRLQTTMWGLPWVGERVGLGDEEERKKKWEQLQQLKNNKNKAKQITKKLIKTLLKVNE